MKLYIDSSNNQKIILRLGKRKLVRKIKLGGSEKLLTFIDELLKKEKKTVRDLTAIEVNLGPGSFSGLRVGVAVANALGWALKIPVNGKRVDQAEVILPQY